MPKASFLRYLLKFILTFCVLYYGTIAFIGIAAPGGVYWVFADRYLNYVAGLRYILLQAARGIVYLAGHDTYLKDAYTIKLMNGSGVHVGYDCIGYGVMFFWMAFIYANSAKGKLNLKWMLGGLLLIWLVNVIRIAMMLFAVNYKWKPLLNFDNHTWFNIVAYALIFLMIYMFDRSEKAAINSRELYTDR